MRPSSALLLLSSALLHQQTTALTIPIPSLQTTPTPPQKIKGNPYRDRDLSSLLSGSFEVLDRVPGLVDKVVNTTLLVVRALRETVAENGITQNDLDTALGINGTTGMPLPLPGNTTRAVTCPDVAVLFARGTNEPGNVGFLTGPPFFDALRTYMNGTGSIAIQGVNSYPADPPGFFAGGSATGAAFAAQVASRTLSACPDTRLTVSGYSQGSQVARLAVAQLPPDQRARLSSVVLFGDPLGGKAIDGVDPTKLLVVCHTGDNICQGGNFIFNPHLDYSLDAPTAALFVMQRSKLGLASRDALNEGMGDTMVGTVQGIMHSPKDGIASD